MSAWVNLVIASIAMVATLPGRTQGLGLITEALIADFRMDRVTYANINLWATLIGSAFCLPCGRMTDRFGPRGVLAVLLGALGATVIWMSQSSAFTAIFVGVTLTRGFGQSALSVVSLTLVGKWFVHRLSFAMGIYSLLVGCGFIAAFPSVGHAVVSLGWRTAWLGVGYSVLALAPIACILVRNPTPAVSDATRVDELGDLTFGEALSSVAFWTFAFASSMFGLIYSGIALFNQSILEERGFAAATYHSVLVVSTLTGLLANFAGGWLAQRWPIRRIMGTGMVALAAAVAMLPLVRSHTHVMLYGVTMGVSGGVVTVVFFSVWGQVFGRRHLGRIQGCAQMMTVLASAIGPLVLAQTLRATGSYESIFYALSIVALMLGVLCWWVPMPLRQRSLAPLQVPGGPA